MTTYTPEQEEKIERLRKERDFERKLKHKELDWQIEKQESFGLH